MVRKKDGPKRQEGSGQSGPPPGQQQSGPGPSGHYQGSQGQFHQHPTGPRQSQPHHQNPQGHQQGDPVQYGPSRQQLGGYGRGGRGRGGQQFHQEPQQSRGPRQDQRFHQDPQHSRGPRQGQQFHQDPQRHGQGDGQRTSQKHGRFEDPGFQQSQRSQEQYGGSSVQSMSFERSTAVKQSAWGKKPEQSVQQPAPVQPTTTEHAEAKLKGKDKGKSVSTTTPTTVVSEAAPQVEEKGQPLPTEAKPGKKQKGKGQQSRQPAAPVAPSPSTSGAGDIVTETAKLTLQTSPPPSRESDEKFPHPSRKSHEIIHSGPYVQKKFWIEVNYLPLKIKDPRLQIFHYDVTFNPDTPKYLLRKAIEQIRKQKFPDRYPAFDGKKNMYVAGRALNADTIRDSVSVYNHETCKEKEFDITIKLVNSNLNISRIFEYCKTGVTAAMPQTEIQGTDIALRSGLTDHFTPAGRSFFARPTRDPVILGGGFELWHGFYQSAIAAWKPYLNVDVANKAFPIEQRVLDYMCDEFRCRPEEFRQGLQPYQKDTLDRFIKGLKISYEMPGQDSQVQKRIYRVTGLGGTPVREKFTPKDGPEMSVGMYYQREKKYNIKYSELPLLKVGTKGSMVPIELCSIVGDQAVMRKLDENQTANMVKAAARPTTERKERIDFNIRRANYANNPTLREFGIEVQTSFEKVEAVVIKPPDISYARNIVPVRDGVWRMDRENFITAQEIPQWAVLNLNARTYPNKIQDLERLVVQVGRSLGMNVPPPIQFYSVNQRDRIQENNIDRFLLNFRQQGVGLVFVILSNSNEVYGQVKRASELRTGVLTQCIKSRTVERINPMTITNILLKVNSKLRGVNHSLAPQNKPEVLKTPCMLVGADVTHPAPGPGAEGTPSIAAVAASHDRFAFQYKMLYRLQRSREEMIVDLANMMKDQLQTFYKANNRFPERIIYYRDGVSEGQFQQVLNVELVAIRRACTMIRSDYKPLITFLVVQKRHHTRFFPQPRDGDRKNCNVPAGTLVDKQITHPTEVDFYLVSHQSIQGTARPTKYHLLWDDSNIPQIELEKLTYYLCHMFARCTRSVSYPAPTYYAHLAAFRARAWWDRMGPNMAQLNQEQERRGQISSDILDNYPMFFT